jgi:hypothetical protein
MTAVGFVTTWLTGEGKRQVSRDGRLMAQAGMCDLMRAGNYNSPVAIRFNRTLLLIERTNRECLSSEGLLEIQRYAEEYGWKVVRVKNSKMIELRSMMTSGLVRSSDMKMFRSRLHGDGKDFPLPHTNPEISKFRVINAQRNFGEATHVTVDHEIAFHSDVEIAVHRLMSSQHPNTRMLEL